MPERFSAEDGGRQETLSKASSQDNSVSPRLVVGWEGPEPLTSIKAPDFGSHLDFPTHPSPGDKVLKKQSLIKTFMVAGERGAGAPLPTSAG